MTHLLRIHCKSWFHQTFVCTVIIFSLAFNCKTLQAQTNTIYFEDWTGASGSAPSEAQNELLKHIATITDGSGNLYVASSTFNSTTEVYDLLLEKFNSSGTLLWSQQFNITNGGDVLIGDIGLDANDAPIVTGAVLNGTNNYDALTVKYSTSGTFAWSQTWNGTGSGYDGCSALTTDASNNIYVTGGTVNGSTLPNFLTIKYTSSGTQSWVQLYDHAGLTDASAKVFYNGGYVMVTGGVQNSVNNWALATVRYNASTGAQVGAFLTTGSIVFDEINGFTTDASDNIYIVGARNTGSPGGYDFLTLKLDANLDVVWETTLDATGGKDVAKAVSVDNSGNVYVTGYATSTGTGRDYMTAKYNASGTYQWKTRYEGTAGLDDEATDIVVDSSGNVFVTGFAYEKENEDFVTIWYDSNGEELWVGGYNSIYNRTDKAATILLDNDGGLLVTGRTGKVISAFVDATETRVVRYRKSCSYLNPIEDQLQASAIVYVKNNGQLVNTDGGTANEVLYYTDANWPWLTFQQDKINFISMKDTSGDAGYHRVDMAFGNETREVRKLFPLDKRSDYFNFYLAHIPQGREFVPLYKRLMYCQIFDGIDLALSTNAGGVKYYYIVNPGADPDNIQLEFDGQSGLSVSGGNFIIETEVGDIVFPQADVYEVDLSGNITPVSWTSNYVLNGNTLSFSTGSYNSDNYLVFEISNNLCEDEPVEDNHDWSTFYASNSSSPPNKGFEDAATDSENSLFVTGLTNEPDFPTSVGFQTALNGTFDAFLLKFNDSAFRRFATYFGGAGDDRAFGVEVDDNGKSYIVGTAASGSTTFPLLDNQVAYFDDINDCPFSSNCADAFIAGFNYVGTLDFATFYGDSGDDTAFDIKRNSQGQFYVVGQGSAVLPLINAPFEEQGGRGFIAKFSPDFVPIWSSTYKEGSINAIDFDDNDNAFITGSTNVSVDILGPTNSLQLPYGGGGLDGFVAKITDSPIDLVWSTNYGGSSIELFNSVKVDHNNDVYIAGYVDANSDIPTFDPFVSGSLFNSSPAGNFDAFFAKFDNNGVPLWGTFFGGTGIDEAYDVEVDAGNNVYFTGVTYDGFTDNTQGFSNYFLQSSLYPAFYKGDAFIVNLGPQLQPRWVTYYGGGDGDRGTGLCISENEKLYMIGLTAKLFSLQPGFPLQDFDGNNLDDAYFQCNFGNGSQAQVAGFISRFLLDETNSVQQPLIDDIVYLKLYPNPGQNSVLVELDNSAEENLILQVFDLTGACKMSLVGLSSKASKEIDISALPNGMYILKAYSLTSNRTAVGKLIIEK